MDRRAFLGGLGVSTVGFSAGCLEGVLNQSGGYACENNDPTLATIYDEWRYYAEEIVSVYGEVTTVMIEGDPWKNVFGIMDSEGGATVVPEDGASESVSQLEVGDCLLVSGRLPSQDSTYYEVWKDSDAGESEQKSIVLVESSWTYL